MVAACAGADCLLPWGAVVTGLVAGLVYLAFHHLIINLRIDDPLDAVAVHYGGGLWGLIATPAFMIDGIFDGGGVTGGMTLAWNISGALVITLWSGGISGILFAMLHYFKVLRVEEEIEVEGMDKVKHKEPAYPETELLIYSEEFIKAHNLNKENDRKDAEVDTFSKRSTDTE